MSKVVFLFPGQGSQKSGMGKDFYENFDIARKIFDSYPDVRDVCFEGTDEQLKQTSFTQPAIYLMSVVIDAVLKDGGIVPEKAAGHSLGEYAALTSAGVFDIETGMKLVKERGRLMQEEGNKIPGTMAAVIGLDYDKVVEVCNKIDGVIEAVNFNAPGQVVVSGEEELVKNSVSIFKENGAKLVKVLNVSGAFHSSLLKDVGEKFKNFITGFSFNNFKYGVVANVTAEEYNSSDEVVDILAKQIYNPVYWTKSIKYLIDKGYIDFIEVGPGNVLKGLLRKIDSNLNVETTNDVEGIKKILEKYGN